MVRDAFAPAHSATRPKRTNAHARMPSCEGVLLRRYGKKRRLCPECKYTTCSQDADGCEHPSRIRPRVVMATRGQVDATTLGPRHTRLLARACARRIADNQKRKAGVRECSGVSGPVAPALCAEPRMIMQTAQQDLPELDHHLDDDPHSIAGPPGLAAHWQWRSSL